MKRKVFRILLAVALGLGLVVAGILVLAKCLGERQTLYRGHVLYYWVEQINRHDAATNEAQEVLTKEILPQLTETMFHDTNDSNVRLWLVENLNGLPGVHIEYMPADGRRAHAAGDIGQFGPSANASIPALLQALKTDDLAVHGAAILSLGKIHAQAETIVPLLLTYLYDENLKDEAVEALGEFGSEAKTAVPKLIPLLEVRDKELHHALVEALQKIDPEAAAKAGVK